MMADKLYLKHIYPNELPQQKFYFYEGEVDVRFGVIELPRDPAFQHWAQRAWMRGYRLDPETGREISRDELIASLSTESASSATQESANEGSDGGGQPTGEDGLRESELPRTDSVPEEGLGSGVSDGAAVRVPANRPTRKAVRSA